MNHKILIMKHYIILLVLTLSLTTYAQEVAKDGKVYEVKNEKIFLDGKEVTATLDLVEKEWILKEAAMISDKLKLKATALKEAEREAKRLETEKKNAEK